MISKKNFANWVICNILMIWLPGNHKTSKYVAYNECIQRLGNIADIYYQTKDTK